MSIKDITSFIKRGVSTDTCILLITGQSPKADYVYLNVLPEIIKYNKRLFKMHMYVKCKFITITFISPSALLLEYCLQLRLLSDHPPHSQVYLHQMI